MGNNSVGVIHVSSSSDIDASFSAILRVRCLYARIHRGPIFGHTAIVVQIVEESDLE